MKKLKFAFSIFLWSILLIAIYLTTYFAFLYYSNLSKLNEFGDYFGGVLNPFFTLLSTIAIGFLTFYISKNESRKADESINIQKILTLNQMRHETLNKLTEKLDMFIYQLANNPIYECENSFIQRVISKNIKDKENKKSNTWITLMYELESFKRYDYLYSNLFKTKEYITAFNALNESVDKLSEEISKYQFITTNSLEEFINKKQEFLKIIGGFILSDFNSKD